MNCVLVGYMKYDFVLDTNLTHGLVMGVLGKSVLNLSLIETECTNYDYTKFV